MMHHIPPTPRSRDHQPRSLPRRRAPGPPPPLPHAPQPPHRPLLRARLQRPDLGARHQGPFPYCALPSLPKVGLPPILIHAPSLPPSTHRATTPSPSWTDTWPAPPSRSPATPPEPTMARRRRRWSLPSFGPCAPGGSASWRRAARWTLACCASRSWSSASRPRPWRSSAPPAAGKELQQHKIHQCEAGVPPSLPSSYYTHAAPLQLCGSVRRAVRRGAGAVVGGALHRGRRHGPGQRPRGRGYVDVSSVWRCC